MSKRLWTEYLNWMRGSKFMVELLVRAFSSATKPWEHVCFKSLPASLYKVFCTSLNIGFADLSLRSSFSLDGSILVKDTSGTDTLYWFRFEHSWNGFAFTFSFTRDFSILVIWADWKPLKVCCLLRHSPLPLGCMQLTCGNQSAEASSGVHL